MECMRQEGESLASQAQLEERLLPANGNVTVACCCRCGTGARIYLYWV